VRDVAEVIVEANIFFATVQILDKKYDTNPMMLKHLKKADALKAQQIIQGLVIAANQNVNITQVPAPELVQTVEQVGVAHHSL
jgi:hypothetical protein